MSLVFQLQEYILSDNIDISTLLRKAWLVADKLDANEFRDWIELEQKGYVANNTRLPTYRFIPCRLTLRVLMTNVERPVYTSDDSRYSPYELRDAASTLQEQIASGSRWFEASLPYSEIRSLAESLRTDRSADFFLKIEAPYMKQVINSIIDKILQWSRLLEKNGIIGEGIIFSSKEKEIAKRPLIINYTTNIYGDISSSQLQQGTQHSSQNSEL